METFTYHHESGSMIAATEFCTKAELDQHRAEVIDYGQQWRDIMESLVFDSLLGPAIRGGHFGTFCP